MGAFAKTCLSTAGVLGLCGILGGNSAPAAAADQVAIQLDYVVRGDHAIFFVGRDKGFFAKNGIDITAIRKGSGSTNTLRLVANGNAEFGFSDLPTLIVGRTQGVTATAIVAVNQKSPLAIMSVKATHPLSRPADLKGLNFGVQPSGSTYIFLKAFLGANGMSFSDIKQSTVAPPYESYLVLGRVDVVPGYLDAEVPELEAKTGGAGSLSILQGADFGYHALGSGVFTSDKMIAEKSELVQRFVKAYEEAFAYTVEHTKEAIDITVKANPEYADKVEVLTQQLQADMDATFFDDNTKQHGLGWISPAQWKESVDTLKQYGGLDADAKIEGGFDDRFVDGSSPAKR